MVPMLVGVDDVGAVLVQQAGDGGHQTFAVGAIDQEDGGVFHFTESAKRWRQGQKQFTVPLFYSQVCHIRMRAKSKGLLGKNSC